jgi:hypothetical protein
VPSSASLGNTSTTDLVPERLSLLPPPSGVPTSGIVLADEGGHSGWIPVNPVLKNDGVRASSTIVDGSQLIAGALDNVTETMRCYLTGSNLTARSTALMRLMRFGEAARAYHETNAQPQPVYLRWWADGAPGDQFALITKIEVSFVEFDLANTTVTPEITISIEREPLWRGIAPGDNPKKWAFHARTLKPTNAASPAADEYNSANLSLTSGAGSYTSFAEATIFSHDEIATSNVNYIDIPAESIPGDAPALTCIEFDSPTSGAGALRALRVGRSTRRNLFTLNNNSITQRARNSFNPGDASIASTTNLGTTQLVQANGIATGGTRYVINLAYGAGAVSGGTAFATWTRAVNQYSGLYAAFVRAQVLAGTATDLTFRLAIRIGSTFNRINYQTDPVMLTTTFDCHYLGTLDFTHIKSRAVNTAGTGLDIALPMRLEMTTIKPNSGATATVQLWDVLLIPIDEPNAFLNCLNSSGTPIVNGASPLFIDNSGYFTSGDISKPAGLYNTSGTEAAPLELYGDGISLVPGINNRLYIVPQFNGAFPTTPHSVRVNIVPRWYGVRDK